VALSPIPIIAVVLMFPGGGGHRAPPVHPPRVTRAAGRRMTIRHAGYQSGE
jgi:hypothetical protein